MNRLDVSRCSFDTLDTFLIHLITGRCYFDTSDYSFNTLNYRQMYKNYNLLHYNVGKEIYRVLVISCDIHRYYDVVHTSFDRIESMHL